MASVASRNLFDILADNEDIEPVVPEKEPAPKENVVVQKKVDRSRASPKEARIRHEYPQRGGFKPSPPSNRNEDTRSGAPRDRNVGPRLYNRREEGGGDYPSRSSRGARASERGRGGRGGRRGREHDRHSGTGRFDSEKKENQGWGSATTNWENNETTETNNGGEADANAKTSSWDDGNADKSAGDGWGEPTEGQESSVAKDSGSGWEHPDETAAPEEWENKEEGVTTNGESAPVVEKEESFKTLDEYRAEKPPKAQVATLPEARKANEGVDDSQWKDAVPLEKDEEDDILFAGKEHSFRLKSKKTKATKNYLEIEAFAEKPGAGYPRGRGRGRGRGGGGGGGPRGRGGDRRDRDGRDNYEGDNRRRSSGGGRGRSRGDYVNLDDQQAFPSLGAGS